MSMYDFSYLSPLTYNQYNPSISMGAYSSYNQIQLMQGDAYKEQQYWLAVYNQAQLRGIKGTTIQDILTQITRTSTKISALNTTQQAAQNYLDFVNKSNKEARNMFAS